MSAKKAGKTRTASPPSKATRFPRTEAALRRPADRGSRRRTKHGRSGARRGDGP